MPLRYTHALCGVKMSELNFLDLSERHIGVTKAIAHGYGEAARVCLDRHHSSPVTFQLIDRSESTEAGAMWPAVDARTKSAWNNTTDATEDGAYALALAAVEHSRGLVAVRRAETRTGADYYIGSPDAQILDLEESFRLEVSGVDTGNISMIKTRLKQKLTQAVAGNSNLPAIACVVGFASLQIMADDVSETS